MTGEQAIQIGGEIDPAEHSPMTGSDFGAALLNRPRIEPILAPEAKPHPQAVLLKGLRDMANFIERHPDAVCEFTHVHICEFDKITALARRGYGLLKKEVTSNWFMLVKEFGPRVKIEWNESRERVCKKVSKGTKVIPAEPAKTVTIEAKPERVEEIFEWECPESLLADDLPEVPPLPNVAKDDGQRPPIRSAVCSRCSDEYPANQLRDGLCEVCYPLREQPYRVGEGYCEFCGTGPTCSVCGRGVATEPVGPNGETLPY